MKNTRFRAIAVAVTLLVVISVVFFLGKSRSNKASPEEALPKEEIIPTVDSSVVVEVRAAAKKGEVEIEIKNAPQGTETADIELSYNRKPQASDEVEGDSLIPEGVIASCQFKRTARDCRVEPNITLGTCSSGVCRYHTVVGKIKVNILFKGSYGKRLFEKEYSI